jgi:hypothetical protein
MSVRKRHIAFAAACRRGASRINVRREGHLCGDSPRLPAIGGPIDHDTLLHLLAGGLTRHHQPPVTRIDKCENCMLRDDTAARRCRFVPRVASVDGGE